MKYIKKLIEYEKNLSGFSFSMQALIISLVLTISTNYGIEKHNKNISSSNMEYLIDTYLEDDILVLPLYDEQVSEGLIATGSVLVTYLKEYNISVTIVGNRIIISPNKSIDELKDITDLEEIKNILTYDEVEKDYNLETLKRHLFGNLEDEGKIVLQLKK